MTFRSVLLGLLGAALVCGVTYFNDAVMHHTMMVGNNLPISVYGLLILFLLLVNPVLFRIWRRLGLSGSEVAVALVLTCSACCIPASGLLRTFTTSLVLPFHLARTNPGWGEHKVVEAVPPRMLADVNKQNENKVLNGFVQGLSVGDKHISLSDVPWSAWSRTLAFWVPLVLVLWVGLLGLSLVVHRQWADHEQLPYPIAGFANALLPGLKKTTTELFANRLFWLGMIPVMLIHLNNYACQWYPDLIPIPLSLDFGSLVQVLPTFNQGGAWGFFWPKLFFSPIAFAFFLPTDVSLSLAIGPFLWAFVAGTLVNYGITPRGPSPNIAEFVTFGAYLGTLLVLLYTGRHYYWSVCRAALFLPGKDRPAGTAVWGARLFIFCMAVFTFYLSVLGQLDWQLALLFTGGTVLTFLVLSRISAETGCFFIQANFYPSAVFLGLFGVEALGPKAVLLLGLFTMILLVDPREAFMPFTVNSLKLLDLRNVRIAGMSPMIVLALVVGLGVALPVTMYLQYDRGADMVDTWATKNAPGQPFADTVLARQRLIAQGRLEASEQVSGWGHFAKMSPKPAMLIAFVVGLGLVLLFTAGRLRFGKWPLHPVLFLIWATYPLQTFFMSFLIGWFIKAGVTKYGGGSMYRALRPLMFGIIAGEMVGGVITMLIGAAYYLHTGLPPKGFNIMPG